MDTGPPATATVPSTTHNTTPPGTSTPLVLTPNPTIRILQPADPTRAPNEPPYRPWTDMDDQELINLKNDTKSRPSWKTGKQLVGYVVILKYAKCDGRSLNKRLTNTVKSRLLTSPRQKTKRLYNTTKGKKECLPLYCQACMLGVSFTALGFVLLSANFSVAIYFPLVSVIMAYSSDYVRMVPDRSRSRDDPMWHHRSYSRQSNSQYRDVWREVPPVRQPRRVLIIVDLEPVRPPVTAVHGDTMESTTCCSLPSLGRMEEYALFTYNVLVHPYHTETLTVNILLYYISQHITYTWDRYLEPTSMDLRWQDSTGDTFVLRNEQTLIDLLREHRPRWTEGQDFGILLPNEIRAFTSPNQPYIMRLSCHAALPNPNMLP